MLFAQQLCTFGGSFAACLLSITISYLWSAESNAEYWVFLGCVNTELQHLGHTGVLLHGQHKQHADIMYNFADVHTRASLP